VESTRRAWNHYVLNNGQIQLGPEWQHVAEAADLMSGAQLSQRAAELVEVLHRRRRRWAIPGFGEAIAYVCGEVNIIKGGASGGPRDCHILEAAENAGLTEADLLAPLVINPGRTSSSLAAMRGKRAWLSRRGLLVHTANTYTGDWDPGPGRRAYASYTAAKVWIRGESRDHVLVRDSGSDDSDVVLKTLAWIP
jgi:hypothetical protein